MNEAIVVSVIVPSYNCIDKLTRALQSIKNLDYPVEHFEVIVVDDGSSDGTDTYVNSFIDSSKLNVSYIFQENRGPSAARNNGIRHAGGKYILIIDADCLVDRNILKHYLKHFPDKTLGGVGGNVIPDDKNLITEYLDYIGVWRPGNGVNGISYLVTANAFFTKDALIHAGYFDEDFRSPGGEEPELCYRMLKKGYRFEYDKDAVVIHSHRTTIKGMVKMFYTHGKGNGIFCSKWPEIPRLDTSYFKIIMGGNLFQRFLFKFLKNVKPGKAVIFIILDYLHRLAFYSGYRSVLKKSGV